MGFEVLVQKDSGVVMLSNLVNENISASVAVNRFRFKKIESIILCCLWTLLSDRLHRGSLDKLIKITLSDLNIELEKYMPQIVIIIDIGGRCCKIKMKIS